MVTFRYSEIVNREAYGPQVDVWSLGCLLYTFLEGRPPFDVSYVVMSFVRVLSSFYLFSAPTRVQMQQVFYAVFYFKCFKYCGGGGRVYKK